MSGTTWPLLPEPEEKEGEGVHVAALLALDLPAAGLPKHRRSSSPLSRAMGSAREAPAVRQCLSIPSAKSAAKAPRLPHLT
jgi:hypothetical protein